MTVHEVSLATGVPETTIRRHIAIGWLDAERDKAGKWDISVAECYSWAKVCWDTGRYYMHNPEWIYNYLIEFHDPIARRNRLRKRSIFEK